MASHFCLLLSHFFTLMQLAAITVVRPSSLSPFSRAAFFGDNGLIQSQLKPSKKGLVLWGNTLIAVVSTMSVAVGAVASVRQIVLDAKTYILFANM
ncbi:hypothetical protein NC651_025916 [Populus alba x Populus x berolinensis]|nr:hypothetical protein NC651_025916 [Populus alba x Populus x berolinensis]